MMKDIISVRELASYLGVATITVYRLTEKGDLPGHKVGGQWRFMRDEVEDWLRQERIEGRR